VLSHYERARRFFFGPNAMTPLDCHALLSELPGDELIAMYPEGVLVDSCRPEHMGLYAPLILTGGITLSGALDDAQTIDDLREAAAHFGMLLSAEIVTWEQWGEAARGLWDELELFCRQFDRVEELN
jgi:hypothetical protein